MQMLNDGEASGLQAASANPPPPPLFVPVALPTTPATPSLSPTVSPPIPLIVWLAAPTLMKSGPAKPLAVLPRTAWTRYEYGPLAAWKEIAGTGRVTYREWPPEKKAIDIGSFYADSKRFSSLTGWKPRVDLRDGFTRTIGYYREHLARYTADPSAAS